MSKGGLAEVKSYALSDSDITKILGPTKIFPYPDLEHMTSIDQCFDDKGRCIILFPNVSATMGHWCCMIRRPKSIEFFDPYGDAPERQKDGLPEHHKENLDIDEPLLTRLMRASGLPVYYNTHPFQSDRAAISTCGRHCVVRLLYAPYSLDKYASIIKKSGLTPDDFVSGVTYDKLRK
jgi:hypothetical protein